MTDKIAIKLKDSRCYGVEKDLGFDEKYIPPKETANY